MIPQLSRTFIILMRAMQRRLYSVHIFCPRDSMVAEI